MDAETRRRSYPPVRMLVALLSSALCLAGASASAQPSFAVSIGRNLTSTSGSSVDNADQITSATVEAEHRFAGDHVRVFYDFEGGDFATGADWGYYLQSAGTTFKAPLHRDGTLTLFVSAFASLQTNAGSWNAPGYRSLSGRANFEWRPRATMAFRTGYLLNHRAFPDLTEMNHLEQDVFASLLVNLPTRTTIVGETHFGGKSYEAMTARTLVPPASEQRRSHGWGLRGNGPGAGTGLTMADGPQGTPKQITWLVRVAQSVADRTGVSIQLIERGTFGPLPPPVIGTPALYFDDGVYDDPFASDAFVLTLNGKHQFAGAMTLEAQAGTSRKNYNSTIALDLDGLPITGDPRRSDRIARAGAEWTVPLFPTKTGPVGLNLGLGYAFVRQHSNDLFYNYTSHALGLSVSVVY